LRNEEILGRRRMSFKNFLKPNMFTAANTKKVYLGGKTTTAAEVVLAVKTLRLERLHSFFKENVRYPVWTCRDQISLILGTRFSILGTRIGFFRPLKHLIKILGCRLR